MLAQSTAPPERIGRYEVLRKIATGGMAELFLAKQVGMEGFEKVVALKRILSHLTHDQDLVDMLRDEAQIVAKLSHPNIVQIYDLGKDEGTYFIAMEYVPGRNLSSITKKARAEGAIIPSEYIARCVGQVCEGLHYAHTREDVEGKPLKIVHRDVSPQNIIVSFSGTVKLVDFGIAKAAIRYAHTQAGLLKGKYSYMSPEQVLGKEIDSRSDLFAVGIVLYELLGGQLPFSKESSIQGLKSIVQDEPVPVQELNPEISDDLAHVIETCLTKDREKRFQNAHEIQTALEDAVRNSAIRCNNVTIAKWVTELFDDELNEEKAVFQGVGEVILPEGAEDPVPGFDDGVRVGGSAAERDPIATPSNALWEESTQLAAETASRTDADVVGFGAADTDSTLNVDQDDPDDPTVDPWDEATDAQPDIDDPSLDDPTVDFPTGGSEDHPRFGDTTRATPVVSSVDAEETAFDSPDATIAYAMGERPSMMEEELRDATVAFAEGEGPVMEEEPPPDDATIAFPSGEGPSMMEEEPPPDDATIAYAQGDRPPMDEEPPDDETIAYPSDVALVTHPAEAQPDDTSWEQDQTLANDSELDDMRSFEASTTTVPTLDEAKRAVPQVENPTADEDEDATTIGAASDFIAAARAAQLLDDDERRATPQREEAVTLFDGPSDTDSDNSSLNLEFEESAKSSASKRPMHAMPPMAPDEPPASEPHPASSPPGNGNPAPIVGQKIEAIPEMESRQAIPKQENRPPTRTPRGASLGGRQIREVVRKTGDLPPPANVVQGQPSGDLPEPASDAPQPNGEGSRTTTLVIAIVGLLGLAGAVYAIVAFAL